MVSGRDSLCFSPWYITVYVNGIKYSPVPVCFLNYWNHETIARWEIVLLKLGMYSLTEGFFLILALGHYSNMKLLSTPTSY